MALMSNATLMLYKHASGGLIIRSPNLLKNEVFVKKKLVYG